MQPWPHSFASTGPRSFERGWRSPCQWRDALCLRFNGAALFRARMDSLTKACRSGSRSLQRGRALSSADGCKEFDRYKLHHLASTGPRSFERGWPRGSIRSARRSIRFNGAALFRARMAAQLLGADLVRDLASTGPRSFERGWGKKVTVCAGTVESHLRERSPRSCDFRINDDRHTTQVIDVQRASASKGPGHQLSARGECQRSIAPNFRPQLPST